MLQTAAPTSKGRALLKTLFALVVNVIIMFALLLPIKGYVSSPGTPAPWWGWAIALALYPLFALQAVVFHRWVDRRPWREFPLAWDAKARRTALWGSVLSLALLLAFVGLTQVSGLARWSWNAGFDPTWTIMTALLLLQAGLGEEFIYRGYLLESLAPFGPAGSALINAALFTLMHLVTGRVAPLELAALFLHGLLYVAILRRTGSIWPGVIIHGVYDSLTGLIWANGAATSLLHFDGDVTWLKWVFKAAMVLIYLLMLKMIYAKRSDTGAARRTA